MRCCVKRLNRLLFVGLVLLASVASAEGLSVQRAEGRLMGSNYLLSASFDISFNYVVEQALTRGVTLYFNSEFNLRRPRWYWFDEALIQSEQTTKLSYNALTRQYRIGRGALFQNFSSLEDALRALGHQTSTVVPEASLDADSTYVASVRMRLDVNQLPKPLQVNSLTSKEWNLDSDVYTWIVHLNNRAAGQ